MKSLTALDWFFMLLTGLLVIMFFYQAWENIVNRRISRWSLDALGVSLGYRFGSDRTRERIQKVTRTPKRMFLAGIYALGLGLAMLYVFFQLLGRFALP